MTVFLSHTMSSVAHTARSSSAECLLVSLHNASRLFWADFLQLQIRQKAVKIQSSASLKPAVQRAGAT
jgi:hypothetical protein